MSSTTSTFTGTGSDSFVLDGQTVWHISQCPIQPGQIYTYNYTLIGQLGTLWWYAHILWLRTTIHGVVIILPKLVVPYPFPKPSKEVVILLGEWWKLDIEAVTNEAIKPGLAPNVSDAHIIIGHPAPLSSCSSQGPSRYILKGTLCLVYGRKGFK